MFRSNNRAALDAIQPVVRGTVRKSPNPRAEETWFLASELTEIDALMTTDSARYEAWLGRNKIRDCDGSTCRFCIDPKTGERREGIPCWCAAQQLHTTDEHACRLTTRINLFIPAFSHLPGVGIWQVETRGLTTFQDFKGFQELFRSMRFPSIVGGPVTVRIEIVKSRNRQFPVFRFRTKLSFDEMVARAKAFAKVADVAALPAPDDSAPPLGADLTQEQKELSNAAPIVDPRATLGSPDGQSSATAADGAPAPDVEPVEMTARDQEELRDLVNAAAAADGFKGPRAWLQARFNLAVKAFTDIPRSMRAEVRSRAIAILSERRDAQSREAGAQPASPDQLKALEAAFAELEYTPIQIVDAIRQHRPDAANPTLADLTAAQAKALLDGLRVAELRAS